MSELTPDTAYPEVAKERRSSSFSEAHLEKVFWIWTIWQWHNNSLGKHSVTKTVFYRYSIVYHLHLEKECLFVSAYLCLHLRCHVFRQRLRCHLNLKLTWEIDSGISTSYIDVSFLFPVSLWGGFIVFCSVFRWG